MLDMFKMWISSMLCLGIFITFLQLVIPKTNLKKYIYSLVGILTIITIISPVVNLLKDDYISQGVTEVIANISGTGEEYALNDDKYDEVTKKALRNDLSSKIKEDIEMKLKEQEIKTNSVEVNLDDSYNIGSVEININKVGSGMSNVNRVVKYINEEYGIEYSKISVVEEGE